MLLTNSNLVHLPAYLHFVVQIAIPIALGYQTKCSLASTIAENFSIDRIDKMIVHRLDYATSGVVVFARNEAALRELHWQFRNKDKIYKSYLAHVNGILPSYEGEIDLPVGKDPEKGSPFCKIDCISESSKVSYTEWQLIESDQARHESLVRLTPRTGR